MWSTYLEAVAELRTQLQDDGTTPRYADAELGKALAMAVAELGGARPLLILVHQTVGQTRMLRLDDKIGAAVFGSVVSVLDLTDLAMPRPIVTWQYYEQAGQHMIFLPTLDVGTNVAITVRGGYGWGLVLPDAGTLDTNIPMDWRSALIGGAQGYALELYGAREIGRTNVSPAMAQQTARAAAVKLRDFRQWLAALPYADTMHQFVTWGLDTVDSRTGDHRGFG